MPPVSLKLLFLTTIVTILVTLIIVLYIIIPSSSNIMKTGSNKSDVPEKTIHDELGVVQTMPCLFKQHFEYAKFENETYDPVRNQNLSFWEDTIQRANKCHPFLGRFVKNLGESAVISSEIMQYIEVCNNQRTYNLSYCRADPKVFDGPIEANMEQVTLKTLKAENKLDYVHYGGWLLPGNCRPKHSIAVIIPFRKREDHLPILLRSLYPILHKRGDVHIRFFIIDQTDKESFNRGKLRNVGFLEAQKYFPYTCFIFHDVDLIPEDDRIPYTCDISPVHLSVGIDKFEYKLPYRSLFGGIQVVSKQHYELANGFANTFWDWGAEDDNFYTRLIDRKNVTLYRPPADVARYKMLKHDHVENYESWDIVGPNVEYAKTKYDNDGLNSIQYDLLSRADHEFYTRIQVDLRRDQSKF